MLTTLALLISLAGYEPAVSYNDPELQASRTPAPVDARLRKLLQLKPGEGLTEGLIYSALEKQFPEGMARSAFEKKLLKGLALKPAGKKESPPMTFFASADSKSSCWVSQSGANCLLSNSQKESDESGVARQYKIYFSFGGPKRLLRNVLIDEQSHYCTTSRRPSVQCMSKARQLCEKRGDTWREIALAAGTGFSYGCEANGKNRRVDH